MSDQAPVTSQKDAFTPGPWSVETSGRGHLCVVADDAWICGEIDNQPHEMADEESTANAYLIASSPDLFAALTELVRCVRGGDETAGVSMDDALQDADAALEKACIPSLTEST